MNTLRKASEAPKASTAKFVGGVLTTSDAQRRALKARKAAARKNGYSL